MLKGLILWKQEHLRQPLHAKRLQSHQQGQMWPPAAAADTVLEWLSDSTIPPGGNRVDYASSPPCEKGRGVGGCVEQYPGGQRQV